MHFSKKLVSTSFMVACTILSNSHMIKANITQTKTSCSIALSNKTAVKFDNRELKLRDATSLSPFCQQLLFLETFPNSQCVVGRSYPELRDGKLPAHSELFRQFAGISLQRMLTSTVRPFLEPDPLKNLLAPPKTYRDIANALDKLQIIRTDEFCFGYLTLASNLLSKFRGYKFIEELRVITTKNKGSLIMYPGQLSPFGLIPGPDTRYWAQQMLLDHNIVVLVENNLKLKEVTTSTTTGTTTTTTRRSSTRVTFTTTRVTTTRASTTTDTTTTTTRSTFYNASISAEIEKLRDNGMEDKTDDFIFENLKWLRRIPTGTKLREPTAINPKNTAKLATNPIFDRSFSREIDGSGIDEGLAQDQLEGLRTLKDTITNLDNKLIEVDEAQSEAFMALLVRADVMTAFKETSEVTLQSIKQDLVSIQDDLHDVEDCCERAREEDPLSAWQTYLGVNCCTLGIILSLVSIGLTLSIWTLYICLKCASGKCTGVNSCIEGCCQNALATLCCCTCKADQLCCGRRCHDVCYEPGVDTPRRVENRANIRPGIEAAGSSGMKPLLDNRLTGQEAYNMEDIGGKRLVLSDYSTMTAKK